MTQKQPRLDRTSLIRLGHELQAAHHRSEKQALSERHKDLLLEWAIREAVQAAQNEPALASRVSDQAAQNEPALAGRVSDQAAQNEPALAGRVAEEPQVPVPMPFAPPQVPQPITTAPRAINKGDGPVLLLLYSPGDGGWHTGYWWGGRWCAHLNVDIELQPTHWLPPMLAPPGET